MVLEGAIQFLTADFLRLILFEILFFLVSGFFIWAGSHIAQIKKASYGKAVLAAILTTLVTAVLIIPFSQFALFTFVLSLLIAIGLIKMVFSTGWRKALVTWVFSLIAQIVVVAGLVILVSVFL